MCLQDCCSVNIILPSFFYSESGYFVPFDNIRIGSEIYSAQLRCRLCELRCCATQAKLNFPFTQAVCEITTERVGKWVRLRKQCDRVEISLFFSYTLYNFITLQLY